MIDVFVNSIDVMSIGLKCLIILKMEISIIEVEFCELKVDEIFVGRLLIDVNFNLMLEFVYE